MLTTLQISDRYDAGLIKSLTPILGPDAWGVSPGEDVGAQTIIFDDARTAEVLAAIDGYDAHVLDRAKVARIDVVSALRKSAIMDGFSFDGMPLRLDVDTENALVKAHAALSRQPEGAAIDWEVSRGVFMTFDLATVGAISDAAFAHVQAAFTNARRLTTLINAAEDLDALADVDLESGWATNTPA